MALGLAQYCPKTSAIYQVAPKLIQSVWTSLGESWNGAWLMYRRNIQPIFVEYRWTLGPNLRILHDPILRFYRCSHRRSDRSRCPITNAPPLERIKSLLRRRFDPDANSGVTVRRGADHWRYRFYVSILQAVRTAYLRAQVDLPSPRQATAGVQLLPRRRSECWWSLLR
jgi:hypothetical protein